VRYYVELGSPLVVKSGPAFVVYHAFFEEFTSPSTANIAALTSLVGRFHHGWG